MRLTQLLPLAAAALLMTGAAAHAQQATNVGVANPAKIFNQMKETADLKIKLDDDGKKFKIEDDAKKVALRDLQTNRDSFKPGTQPYEDANKKLLNSALEYRVWAEMQQAEQQRIQKQGIRSLYDKIAATSGEIAATKGMDIVIAEGPELPLTVDQVNMEQLQTNINLRNVLYAKEGIDITAAVLASLDAKYQASGGATTPPPAGGVTPAPTDGTTPAPITPAPTPAPNP